MAAKGIDANTFPYYPPNFSQDIRMNKRYIFLGSFHHKPTLQECHQEQLRELIIKTNFESKKALFALGKIKFYSKQPSRWYHWQLIKASFSAGFWPILKVNLFFIVYLVGNIALVISLIRVYLKSTNSISSLTLAFFITSVNYLFNRFFIHRVEENNSLSDSILDQTQKLYLDPFVAFQDFSQLPPSMDGFDPHQLANDKTHEGWIDPISLDPIPPDQISSTQILRIGLYAIPIVTALKSMLIRSRPRGEIPHPLEQRKVTPEEKTKFLRETSAFFAILNPQKLEGCWNVSVTSQEVDAITSKIEEWPWLLPSDQNFIYHEITLQVRQIKRKEAFLKLIPRSIAETYFDESFRSSTITVPPISRPTEQERLEAQQGLLRDLFSLILMVTTAGLTTTSGQSESGGRLF